MFIVHKDEKTEKFDSLYEEIFPVLVKISYHMTGDVSTAEELCQEAFVRYYQRMELFPDPKQATYWLIRVVKNLSLNLRKRKEREQRAYQRYIHEPRKQAESGETEYLKSETKESVHQLLDKLPEKLKEAVVLREYGNLSYREMAKVLRISESNAKVRVFRAREMIGTMIQRGELYVP